MMHNRIRGGLAVMAASSLGIALTVVGSSVTPAGASADPGVNVATKTITIGATVPLTNIAAKGPGPYGYSDVAKSALSVFNYVNTYKVNGWKVNFIVKDDQYNLGNPGTVPQTNALLSTPGGLFATVGSLGTSTQQLVINTLKSNQVPQLFVNSGAHYWNDPVNNPGLFGFQTNYLAEGKVFATYIKSKFSGKTVGVLGQNDDFGQDGLQGLKNGGVTPSGANTKTYNSSDVLFNVGVFKTAIDALHANGVQVLVLDTIPFATNDALKEIKALGWKPTIFISGVGSDPQTVNNATEVGAYSFSFLPASATTTNPWNKWTTKILKSQTGKTVNGVSTEGFKTGQVLNGNQQYGVAWAVAFLQALNVATSGGKTPTRASFLTAMTTTKFATPAVVALQYSSTNHQGLTGGYLVSVSSTKATKAVNTTIYNVNPNTQALTTTKLVNSPVPAWLH